MKRKILLAAVALGVFFAPAILNIAVGNAQAVPPNNCGGNQTIHYTPFDRTNYKQFNVGAATRVIKVVLHFDQGNLASSATFTLDKPAPAAFKVRVVAHVGLSGDGLPVPPDRDVTVDFPAGSVGPVVVQFTTACGQADVKAVFIANGDERGRVAGPYVCVAAQAPPTTPAPVVPTTPATSAPAGSVTPSVTSGSTQPPQAGVRGALPPTGNGGPEAWQVGLIAVALGALLVYGTRRAARA